MRVDEATVLQDLGFKPYRCVVVIEDQVSKDKQNEISDWLVATGCLYMMAWGPDCSSWDDSVDASNCEQFNYESIPEESFVMTTWHENESLDEVFWFAQNSTDEACDGTPIDHTLILHVSVTDKRNKLLAAYEKCKEDA